MESGPDVIRCDHFYTVVKFFAALHNLGILRVARKPKRLSKQEVELENDLRNILVSIIKAKRTPLTSKAPHYFGDLCAFLKENDVSDKLFFYYPSLFQRLGNNQQEHHHFKAICEAFGSGKVSLPKIPQNLLVI